MESIGEFEFSRDDVIGRGGFGAVFKGKSKLVIFNIFLLCFLSQRMDHFRFV